MPDSREEKTIPCARLVCGNCKQWKPDRCELIMTEKTATSISCVNIWKDDNYILEKEKK